MYCLWQSVKEKISIHYYLSILKSALFPCKQAETHRHVPLSLLPPVSPSLNNALKIKWTQPAKRESSFLIIVAFDCSADNGKGSEQRSSLDLEFNKSIARSMVTTVDQETSRGEEGRVYVFYRGGRVSLGLALSFLTLFFLDSLVSSLTSFLFDLFWCILAGDRARGRAGIGQLEVCL